MQFFAGVCMHMFRTCVVIHKQFVKCGTFDEALAMFRAAVKEAQNPEARQCPDKGRDDATPATGSGKDPAPEGDNAINGKDAADIYDESNEAGFCMEWCFERKQMVRVTHVKFRVRNIILWRNRDATTKGSTPATNANAKKVLNFKLAFLLKSLYYIKSILPFLILPYFCNKFLKQKQLKIIYYLLFSFALFSIIEFYILQYVSIWSFGQDWPFKLRNGLYRAMALTGHPISLGILNFMGILIGNEIFKTKKRYLLVFVVSLILTGSRIPLVFLAFYIFYCTRNFKIKLLFNKYFYFKTLYALSIPLSFVAIFFIPTYFNNVNEGSTTRLIAIENGVKVFKNPKNILFGTGYIV